MNIDKLKKKRQQNVQEQTALRRDGIFTEASYWRKVGIPIGLRTALKGKGVEISSSIYLEYEQDYPGVSTDEGIVVAEDSRFYKFAVDLNTTRTEVIGFDVWEEITQNTEIKEHKGGAGSTWGFLALDVLRELNSVI